MEKEYYVVIAYNSVDGLQNFRVEAENRYKACAYFTKPIACFKLSGLVAKIERESAATGMPFASVFAKIRKSEDIAKNYPIDILQFVWDSNLPVKNDTMVLLNEELFQTAIENIKPCEENV